MIAAFCIRVPDWGKEGEKEIGTSHEVLELEQPYPFHAEMRHATARRRTMPIIPVLILRLGGDAVLLLTLREGYYACSYCREVMPALRFQLMTHTSAGYVWEGVYVELSSSRYDKSTYSPGDNQLSSPAL